MNLWQHMRIGDWLMLLLGALFTVWLTSVLWHGGVATKVLIRSGGQVFAELPLDQAQRIQVPGPLGVSIVEIASGQARVAADPSPRQLCVKQGWLKQAGDAALCLPNQLSVELAGARPRFDSLSY